jgi:hypothetical protein
MQACKRVLVAAVVCVASLAVAQSEDPGARVFGPHWRKFCRDSGMIFSGTVLEVRSARFGESGRIPVVRIRLRVDHPIVGVQSRRTLIIREWAGAWSEHPMHPGQRVLLLLYPQSRLGLTSPVGGSVGQVSLSEENTIVQRTAVLERQNSAQLRRSTGNDRGSRITLSQLERSIRNARRGLPPTSPHGREIAEEDRT